MSGGGARKRLTGGQGEGDGGGGSVRQVANSVDQHTLSPNERILNDVFNIYMDKDFGFCKIGKMLDMEVPFPRRRITVLLIGNHSAGKSSFINWYVEESMLKTGVAIETQGFFLITGGKKRETLKGPATLQLYPHLKPMENMPGVLDYLTTEISTSRSRKFNMVTFIDTPGLVDGDMHYPFDVDQTLLWLGGVADLIFVFFDPIGQALCKRTLNIVERLWASHSDKIKLYLAKADDAGNETDRQKVLMQIVQELCKRPGLNRTGFDMPTIYIPDIGSSSKVSKCANQIQEVCTEIEKVIEYSVQKALNDLKRECSKFQGKINHLLKVDMEARSRNFSRSIQGWGYGILGLLLPLLLLGTLVVSNASVVAMRKHIGGAADIIHALLNPLASLWAAVPGGYHLQIVTFVVVVSGVLVIISRLFTSELTLPKNEVKNLKLALDVVNETAERQKSMYNEYLRQSLADGEFLHG